MSSLCVTPSADVAGHADDTLFFREVRHIYLDRQPLDPVIVYAVQPSPVKQDPVPVLGAYPLGWAPFISALAGDAQYHRTTTDQYWTLTLARSRFRKFKQITRDEAVAIFPDLPLYLTGECVALDLVEWDREYHARLRQSATEAKAPAAAAAAAMSIYEQRRNALSWRTR